MKHITQARCDEIALRLNLRPRKRYRFFSPLEIVALCTNCGAVHQLICHGSTLLASLRDRTVGTRHLQQSLNDLNQCLTLRVRRPLCAIWCITIAPNVSVAVES